jgi:hypothetical protein
MGVKAKGKKGKGSDGGNVLFWLVVGLVQFLIALAVMHSTGAIGADEPAINVEQMGDPNTDFYAWMALHMRANDVKSPGPYPQLSSGADPVRVRVEEIGWYFRKFLVSKHPLLYKAYKETGQLPYNVSDSRMLTDQLFLDPGKKYSPIAGDGRGWIYKIIDPNYLRQHPVIEEKHGKRCVAHLQRLDMIFEGRADQVDWSDTAFAQSRDDSLRNSS